jgi:hypothetical protein
LTAWAPIGVETHDGSLEPLGLVEAEAMPADRRVDVRLEDAGGEVLGHAILHDLHAVRTQPPDRGRGSPIDHGFDLLGAQ